MAETNQQQMDVEFKGMPGADALSKEEAEPFQVSLNFDEPEAPEEEVEFPAAEEVGEEVAEAVVEEVVDESVNEDTNEDAVSEETEAKASDADGDAEQEVAERGWTPGKHAELKDEIIQKSFRRETYINGCSRPGSSAFTRGRNALLIIYDFIKN